MYLAIFLITPAQLVDSDAEPGLATRDSAVDEVEDDILLWCIALASGDLTWEAQRIMRLATDLGRVRPETCALPMLRSILLNRVDATPLQTLLQSSDRVLLDTIHVQEGEEIDYPKLLAKILALNAYTRCSLLWGDMLAGETESCHKLARKLNEILDPDQEMVHCGRPFLEWRLADILMRSSHKPRNASIRCLKDLLRSAKRVQDFPLMHQVELKMQELERDKSDTAPVEIPDAGAVGLIPSSYSPKVESGGSSSSPSALFEWTGLPLLDDPLGMIWNDMALFVNCLPDLYRSFFSFDPSALHPLHELYPIAMNIKIVLTHFILLISQLSFLIIVPILVVTLPATCIFGGGLTAAFIVTNKVLCRSLNGGSETLWSNKSILLAQKTENEHWVYIGGGFSGQVISFTQTTSC